MISALFIKFNFGEFEAKDQREGGREGVCFGVGEKNLRAEFSALVKYFGVRRVIWSIYVKLELFFFCGLPPDQRGYTWQLLPTKRQLPPLFLVNRCAC